MSRVTRTLHDDVVVAGQYGQCLSGQQSLDKLWNWIGDAGAKGKGFRIRTPELYQNTPNPFSGETKIGFWLPESMTATLKVMDVTGKSSTG